MLYFDNLSTMAPVRGVREAMLPFLREEFGNPSSLHKPGRTAHNALGEARLHVANLLNAQVDEVYITPSGTHGNNTVLLGRARYCEANGLGLHAITSTFEHSSVSAVLDYMEQELGWRVTRLSPEPGSYTISAAQVERAIEPDTTLLTIAAADKCSGALQPLPALAAVTATKNIFFHSDAVLLAARQPLTSLTASVQALTLSGHKFGAPKGVGALMVRRGSSLMPAVFGGGQEMGYFPGTERLADVVGLGAAARQARHEVCEEGVGDRLRDFQSAIFRFADRADSAYKWVGPEDLSSRLPGHVSLQLKSGSEMSSLIEALAERSVIIGASSGVILVQFDASHDESSVEVLVQSLASVR